MKYAARNFRNILKHKLCRALALIAVLGISADAAAVTDSEMEQAKAIAAKFYIRYVNNASGYLDNYTPSSMSELESKLTNDKDRESLREFKKSSVPSDYSSWDKDQLVDYWSITFFQNNASHLDSKAANNGEARVRIKKGISALQIAPPPAPEPEPAAEEAVQEPETTLPEATNPQYDPLADHYANEEEQIAGEIDALQDSIAAEEAQPEEKKSSGTWVYIMILAILVVVVIILVAYASRTMRNPRKKKDEEPLPQTYRGESEGYSRSVADEARLREKYSQSLAEKSEEIMELSRQLTDMEMKAAQLKEENRLLKLELEGYRNAASERNVGRTPAAPPAPTPSPSSGHGALHEVYLGRVNSRGIFVRADRQPVEGQSIYRLSTTNGVAGTYTVVENAYLDQQLLSDPEKWLAGGCTSPDLYDTRGRYAVRTETPGHAVFKDGAWRVERKAVIRYE